MSHERQIGIRSMTDREVAKIIFRSRIMMDKLVTRIIYDELPEAVSLRLSHGFSAMVSLSRRAKLELSSRRVREGVRYI